MRESYEGLQGLLDALGLDEFPMAILTADKAPEDGYCPKPQELPTAAMERAGQVDHEPLWKNFSCIIGHIWLARKKRKSAWISAEHFGCLGAAFWLGFNKPQLDSIISYVANGIPGVMEGEHYMPTPEECGAAMALADPEPVGKPYLVFKPLDLLEDHETPELVTFFCRPESLTGLHSLTSYVTGKTDAVRSPWSSGCGSLWAWPMHYRRQGIEAAVLGGWDPSARKFYKTDELSFTVPVEMFEKMCARWRDSFLTTPTWKLCQSKIKRSKKTWGES